MVSALFISNTLEEDNRQTEGKKEDKTEMQQRALFVYKLTLCRSCAGQSGLRYGFNN